MQDFEKIINPGSMLEGNQRARIFCKIKFTDGNLSITGVIGPKANGDAIGGCGQIDSEFWHQNPAHNDRRTSNPIEPSKIKFTDGWTAEKWLKFLAAWHVFHLNDMQAGCEHQRANNWGEKELQVDHFTLKPEICSKQSRLEEKIAERLKKLGNVALNDDEKSLYGLEYSVKVPGGDSYFTPAWVLAYYNKKETNKKPSGWLTQEEHPEGVLSKPCPQCGYKYGSAWKRLEVPENILIFLKTLPETKVQPAWV